MARSRLQLPATEPPFNLKFINTHFLLLLLLLSSISCTKPTLPSVEPTYDPSRPQATVQILYNYLIPDIPGKSIVTYLITNPPNGSTPPHSHAGAFVSAHILSGYVLNAINDDPMELLGPGDSYSEPPGDHHRISENACVTEPATFIATLVVDTKAVEELGAEGLTVIGDEYKEMIAKAQNNTLQGRVLEAFWRINAKLLRMKYTSGNQRHFVKAPVKGGERRQKTSTRHSDPEKFHSRQVGRKEKVCFAHGA
ncbi:hypothetical protein V496_01002 [Pseudogymnoascus sp. VKM F-4515 (FW-2607)]|nr:hypothetical protein V496_01002 [Pseudogymnoascus sp. VKM F-4515 (FW-2607)]